MKTKIMTKVLSATLALSMMFGAGAAAIGNTSVNPFAIKASAADTMTVKLDRAISRRITQSPKS